MNIAVISLTENGRLLSAEISEKLSTDLTVKRYCFYKHKDDDAESFSNISELSSQIFENYDALVFVSACGIAIRAVAPKIRSKATDPAVIVIDESGRFVVPLLSGHLGNVNSTAELLAERISAVPVITTATDTGKRFSPDSFAQANNLLITDMNAAREVAAAILEDEEVGFFCDYAQKNLPAELAEGKVCRTGIVISNDLTYKPFEVTLTLVPKNIVIGASCHSGTEYEMFHDLVNDVFKAAGLMSERICALSTIDQKSEEPALTKFCVEHNIPMYTYSALELMRVEGRFSSSEFVRKITGTDNICERSAVQCSEGPLILPKTEYEGVTVAACETAFEFDFNRKAD